MTKPDGMSYIRCHKSMNKRDYVAYVCMTDGGMGPVRMGETATKAKSAALAAYKAEGRSKASFIQ